MTLGNFATKLLLDTKDGITKLRGQEFPFTAPASTRSLIPTLHPSAVLRGGGQRARARPAPTSCTVKRALAHEPRRDDDARRSTRTRDETHALAAALGALLRAGDVVVLAGDLGAGQDRRSRKGIARGARRRRSRS